MAVRPTQRIGRTTPDGGGAAAGVDGHRCPTPRRRGNRRLPGSKLIDRVSNGHTRDGRSDRRSESSGPEARQHREKRRKSLRRICPRGTMAVPPVDDAGAGLLGKAATAGGVVRLACPHDQQRRTSRSGRHSRLAVAGPDQFARLADAPQRRKTPNQRAHEHPMMDFSNIGPARGPYLDRDSMGAAIGVMQAPDHRTRIGIAMTAEADQDGVARRRLKVRGVEIARLGWSWSGSPGMRNAGWGGLRRQTGPAFGRLRNPSYATDPRPAESVESAR